ncbi:PREDICTED: uncharacterized protein LOC108976498 isoform X3 [Bactrocera latifrons]|uniref:uncharacterized protein LOC108976498 isoform X3 n=1 Tax=Bactrocera latifrons TaxID=174628 RepID=UPI0008DC95F2|nr:PREDICTED: uncharacterized protein LOC108976498 isoform X3 [Bactrocera latifrons]XP_018801454.1 PREDICTED: uncharacterized protein LOC108976498 isoform X3 [Bactrocera latifrons]
MQLKALRLIHTLSCRIQGAESFMDNYSVKLEAISEGIFNILYDVQKSAQEIPPAKPYECQNESFGKLFCEDNRYAKHLLLIGRGHKRMSHDLYRKLLNGIPCDKKCFDSDTDFFIGTNNFMQLVRNKSYDVLFVYFDADGMEHFRYISEFQFDGKTLNVTQSRSSMTEVSLKEFIKNFKFTSWKIFLRKKGE